MLAPRAVHLSRAVGPRLLAGLLVSTLLLLLLAACGGSEIRPPKAPVDDTDSRATAAAAVLDELRLGLSRHERAKVLRLAAPDAGARDAISAIYDNAAALGLRGIGFRYVDEDEGEVAPATVTTYGDKAWSATVTTTWRIPGYDTAATHLSARFTFVDLDGTVRLVSAGGGDERGALWLDGKTHVERSPDTLVLTAGAAPMRFATLARQAVVDVRKVLRSWRGKLVVEVPASEGQLEQLLHADKGEYHAIAAVTTSVDGSLVPGAAVHVFVNPAVFDPLGPKGSQVVLSHEATHVATGATFATMPTWLLEGFADFVALEHAGVPLRTAAGQILKQVRGHGAPHHLPTASEFDPSATGLGATYELAWTACRFIGDTYGESKMVAYYEAVNRGASTRTAFRTVLGTTQAAFVRAWSDNLATLAGGVA